MRAFVAVVEEGSFTAAAAREGATQSGMSQHLKLLERRLGVALLGALALMAAPAYDPSIFSNLSWRSVGPARGGRSINPGSVGRVIPPLCERLGNSATAPRCR